ncbi:MAG: class I SAM-dependent methyltransferase [Acidobacteriaceae bacterium]|nr:class I SAM-dependent methyltransferase [Acidobacteriaceae bacterium]
MPQPLLVARGRILHRAEEIREQFPLFKLQYFSPHNVSFGKRKELARRMRLAHEGIECAHTHAEMDRLIRAILAIPVSTEGCIIEAGCFKGGSTAKLSLAAKIAGRKLIVFDSFSGIPSNQEEHGTDIFGRRAGFREGNYVGRLEEVRDNVSRFGEVDCCEFVEGWFEDTMPAFQRPVALAFIDVDLASSTRTCLQYLYPLLVPGGSIFSHDGHLPLCIQAIDDDEFWTKTVGYSKPQMPDLGKKKLLQITKPIGV